MRLQGFDYSQAGAYFVTICAWQKECVFGDIVDVEMRLSEYGGIVNSFVQQIPEHFPNVEIDNYVVMPNHVHIIIMIRDTRRGMACHAPTPRKFGKPIAKSLSTIIGSFKSAVTKQINQKRNSPGTPVWQRNYYEGIIRNEKELTEIRKYIHNNPLQRALDIEHPDNIPTP